ncbi:MAG TPA: YceI family protein [Ohtaekwangia sp.]|uniref:YceI family protein n=1 Tax=Ohtaekwangia sp. TaxID=2066019 RepID=UPI002F9474D7
MKTLCFSLLLSCLYLSGHGQIFITTTAKVQFFSETPLENISAINSNVSSLINTNTDSVLVRMKNTAFVFKNALMQEHFNENYMESTKYPIDSFRGKINENIDYAKDGVYSVTATGTFMLHGVEKTTTIPGTLTIKNNVIHLDAELMVHTADFKIEIPKLVFSKIAEDIKVNMSADYKPKK